MKTFPANSFLKKTSAALGGFSGLIVLLVKISNNMKNMLVIMFILIGLLFSTCKNKNKNCQEKGNCPPEYYRFRLGEAKDYLWAKPGSYWIYKQTGTGILDTQIVTGFLYDSITVKGTEDYSQHITIEYDKVYRVTTSSYRHWTYNDETIDMRPNAEHYKNWVVILNREGSTVGNAAVFVYPVLIGNGYGNTSYEGMDSLMIIQGKTYTNVAKFHTTIDGIWEDCPPYTASMYYWAKGVGLIKRIALNRSDNWELTEYNIIQ